MLKGLPTQRLVALFAAGWALLTLPLLELWDRAVAVFGVPLLPAAVFAGWARADRPRRLDRRARRGLTPCCAAPRGHRRLVGLPAAAVRRRPRTPTGARAQGRSVIGNAWVYTLSIGVYCTAWTYFGSVGRAATAGLWFLPIYLGPTLAMMLAWVVLRKMIRIARAHRITSIADFIASRYGKSPTLAGLVTLIAMVGIVPYIALQLKAVAGGYALLTGGGARRRRRRGGATARSTSRWRWPPSPSPSAPATSTPPSATRAWWRRSRSSRWSSCSPSWPSAPSSPGACTTAWRDIFAPRARAPELQRLLAARRRPQPRRRAVVRPHRAVDAVGGLPAAAVPGDGGRERRRAPPQARHLGVPALPAAHQPVRAADRLRRAAAIRAAPASTRRPSCSRCRWPPATRRWRCWPSSAACRRPPAW